MFFIAQDTGQRYVIREAREGRRWMVLVGFGDRRDWKQVAEAEITFGIDDERWLDFLPKIPQSLDITRLLADNFVYGFGRGIEVGYRLGLAAARKKTEDGER